jgi:hypothetical protein
MQGLEKVHELPTEIKKSENYLDVLLKIFQPFSGMLEAVPVFAFDQ